MFVFSLVSAARDSLKMQIEVAIVNKMPQSDKLHWKCQLEMEICTSNGFALITNE